MMNPTQEAELKSKTAEDVMTPLSHCFMLPADTVVNSNTMSMIKEKGYKKIPVYTTEDSKIMVEDILYIEDLDCVDLDDCKTVTEFCHDSFHFVFHDTKLDAMLEYFKKGKSRMSIVIKIDNESEEDPFYEVLGVVTIKDIMKAVLIGDPE